MEATNILTQQQQQERLDDTDLYAVAWADALERYKNAAQQSGTGAPSLPAACWGGRGQGGRGLARRTYQRYDCSVPNVTLEYLGGRSIPLLDDATLKLHNGHVYGVVGQKGKSTLLRRIQARKIPGFPPHLSALYLHRDLLLLQKQVQPQLNYTVSSWLLQQRSSFMGGVQQEANTASLDKLQEELDRAIEAGSEELITSLAEQMALLEDDDDEESTVALAIDRQLKSIQIDPHAMLHELSPGQQQRVLLSLIPLCQNCDIFLLDNPTANLDLAGLLWLRTLLVTAAAGPGGDDVGRNMGSTVVMATGDVDLLNDGATDIIHLVDRKLRYHAGNYHSFVKQRDQLDREQDRVVTTLEKKHVAMQQTLDNIRQQPIPRRGGTKKKAKQISSHKKRMDRELSHVTTASSTIGQRFENDKALQFKFRPCMSYWNEPLIVASDVEFKVAITRTRRKTKDEDDGAEEDDDEIETTVASAVVFDCVDFCVKEGATHVLVGESASGKTALLRILAKVVPPTAGDVSHAPALNVILLDEHDTVLDATEHAAATVLSFMTNTHPSRSAQDVREQLANFGLGPDRVETAVASLSDGEWFRLRLASATLSHEVHVLILDDPTAVLDVDSIDALRRGLDEWNGTVIVSSHDANFVRSLCTDNNNDRAVETFALVAKEQKLRRVPGGIDEYLRSYR
jgi:ATPase subunit of ABC transporter with duplicated ATPase domains